MIRFALNNNFKVPIKKVDYKFITERGILHSSRNHLTAKFAVKKKKFSVSDVFLRK